MKLNKMLLVMMFLFICFSLSAAEKHWKILLGSSISEDKGGYSKEYFFATFVSGENMSDVKKEAVNFWKDYLLNSSVSPCPEFRKAYKDYKKRVNTTAVLNFKEVTAQEAEEAIENWLNQTDRNSDQAQRKFMNFPELIDELIVQNGKKYCSDWDFETSEHIYKITLQGNYSKSWNKVRTVKCRPRDINNKVKQAVSEHKAYLKKSVFTVQYGSESVSRIESTFAAVELIK